MTGSRRVRVKALLALGVLAIVFASGTFAAWTDNATIGGGTFTSGTLDLQVNNGDSHVTTTLGMTAMVPGSTSSEVIVVKNAGTAPLKYSLQGGLTGTDAAAYNTAASLKLTVVLNGTRSGSGITATCTGGTVLVAATSLTSTTTSPILGVRGPVAPGATESVCLQVTLADSAPSSLQGKTASLSLTAVGTSDLS